MREVEQRLLSWAEDAEEHGNKYVPVSPETLRACAAELVALRQAAKALDWIECRAMNGQIQIARSVLRTGYEIALVERAGVAVAVYNGTLREALDKAAKEKEAKGNDA